MGDASVQGQLWGVAPLLPAGDLSWSLRLVSGANPAGADSTAVQARSTLAAGAAPGTDPGSLVLSDSHFADTARNGALAVGTLADFSVVRTGTGSLDLISGGSITQSTLFGVYTAGTQSGDAAVGGAYDLPRPLSGGTVLGPVGDLPGANGATYNAAVQDYRAYYPQGGGDLSVAAQGDIIGNVALSTNEAARLSPPSYYSSTSSNWLWWQGTKATPSAWWINFGTFDTTTAHSGVNTAAFANLVGFTGFGTLGGGDVHVSAGHDAGNVAGTVNLLGSPLNSGTAGGLNVAVGSTGRTNQASGKVEVTGGGDITIAVAGAINPDAAAADTQFGGAALNGVLTDLRGTITVQAGSIGTIVKTYGNLGFGYDPRPFDAFVSISSQPFGGPTVDLGDGTAVFGTRGDQVLSTVENPTLLTQVEYRNDPAAVTTQFSVWQPGTSVRLAALGGDITPIIQDLSQPNDPLILYPPTLDLTAFDGSIRLGAGPGCGR